MLGLRENLKLPRDYLSDYDQNFDRNMECKDNSDEVKSNSQILDGNEE